MESGRAEGIQDMICSLLRRSINQLIFKVEMTYFFDFCGFGFLYQICFDRMESQIGIP